MSTISSPGAHSPTVEKASALVGNGSASEFDNNNYNYNNNNNNETSSVPPPIEEAQPAFKPGRNFLFAFISICILTLAAALDATSLSIALPTIAERLNGTAIEAFWAGTSFLLTSGVCQPVVAGLSHVFGRKTLIILSSLLFAIGAIVAAVATNFTMLYGPDMDFFPIFLRSTDTDFYRLVGRSIQGIGGGGILTLGEIVVTDLVPLVARGSKSPIPFFKEFDVDTSKPGSDILVPCGLWVLSLAL